ncbi:hypothetical protein TCSYLVIO_006908 [Trypanosoma cruzi]|nr:hypothetical protein TCSYLVIO_006908 [Trypanosoma cruzi]
MCACSFSLTAVLGGQLGSFIMLIKLICDDSCGFVKRLGASERCVAWIVEEDLPLSDAAQIVSLNTAITEGHRNNNNNNNNNTTVEVAELSDYVILTPSSGEPIDVRRTPNGLGLRNGTTLRLARAAEQPHSRMRASSDMSRTGTQQQQRGRLTPPPQSNTEDDTDEENDEFYASRQIGWFPFLLRPREGEPLALISDPLRPVRETDAEPNTRPLCETCGALISHGDALRVAVDRHYKPMLMHQDHLEMSMEKLGGGHLRRWQSRFIQMSEKSIDWFAEKPRPGTKSRIHGHRYLVRNGHCHVEAIIHNPDPETYTYCRDKNYYHFAVIFREPRKMYFFRVPSEQQRAQAIGFLETCIKRLLDRAPVRNPVTWKQRVDQFLANAAQLGELHTTNRMAIEALQMKTQSLEDELAEALEVKPKLLAALSTETSYVQTLREELAGYENDVKRAQERVKAEESRLAEEQRLLQDQEAELGDETYKVTVLKQYALQQREEAKKRVAELRERAAALQEEERAVFCRWRRLEEQHRAQQETSRQNGLYSFSEDGVGIPSGSPRLSMELAASAARLTLSSESVCSLSPPLCSPQRPLMFSTSRERES